VSNAGSQPIPGPVSVEDDHLTVACPATGTLEAGAAISCNGTYTITDADIDAGTVTNSATARAGNGSVSGQTTVTVYEKSLQLDAQATPEAYAQVGESIAYTFTITGRSAVPLQGNPIVIADPLQITCETLDAVGNGDQLLDSDEKITCTATQEVTQGDIDNGSIDLQAEADAGNVQSALVMIKVAGPAPAPALTLAKTSPDREYNSIGDVLHYTYVVTNTGNVTLDSTLQVTDDHVDGGAPFDCSAAGPLAPGLFSQCQKSYTITQQDLRLANSSVTNTASAMGSFRQVTVISPPASFTATCPYPGRPWVPFVVSQGETLATISSWYQGTTVTELQEANCMGALDTQPDMTLYVPSPPPTASVSGLVTDSVGSPLGGITVTLVSSSSGAAYRTITNGNGYFYFGGLQPGYYSIFRVGFYLKRGDNRPQNYRVIPQ
jgi:hypothetical protein